MDEPQLIWTADYYDGRVVQEAIFDKPTQTVTIREYWTGRHRPGKVSIVLEVSDLRTILERAH